MHIFALITMGLSIAAVFTVVWWIYGDDMDETDMEDEEDERNTN